MNYRSVIISKKGGPGVLKVVENPLRLPNPDEVRVKVLYTGVGFTDVIMRYGYYAYAPKIPFAPGYEIIGIVDAAGERVMGISVGQKVAALTVYGGYAEYVYLSPKDLISAPADLDPVEALSLILNYATAYQMLHCVARVEAGQIVLITGASGGVGNALLQLGKLAGLKKMYGVASEKKRALVEQLGGIPINYRSKDVTQFIRSRELKGVDAVFDAIGARSAWSGVSHTAKGRDSGVVWNDDNDPKWQGKRPFHVIRFSSTRRSEHYPGREAGSVLRHYNVVPKEPETIPGGSPKIIRTAGRGKDQANDRGRIAAYGCGARQSNARARRSIWKTGIEMLKRVKLESGGFEWTYLA